MNKPTTPYVLVIPAVAWGASRRYCDHLRQVRNPAKPGLGDDEQALRILAACHRAAEPGSTLLVIENAAPSEPEPSPLHLINLFMLVQVGERVRTREEHQALLEAAGYRLEQIITLPPGGYIQLSLLEAHRR